jgi:hypothetical protein
LADWIQNDCAAVQAGETQTVAATTALKALNIAEGGTLAAPEGKLLTLTVDGVERRIEPGEYKGAIVLSVTDDFPEIVDTYDIGNYRGALYVDENGIDANRSAVAALQGGSYDAKKIDGVTIHSENDGFTGMVFTAGEHEIDNTTIELNGCGRNDFAGNGAGIVATGTSKVHVKNLSVKNRGVIRGAILAADNGEITVEDSTIECNGYTQEEHDAVTNSIESMNGVPWMLGLYGNNRATNVVGSGTATYINSTIKAEQWGALSTDGTDSPKAFGETSLHLNTKDCKVEITGASGYGSYSIGAACNTFDHTSFKVPDYALICANEYAAGRFINGSDVKSGRFGVMWHQNQGGVLEVSDSKIETGLTTFLVKGCYPDIRVNRSQIDSGNGVILQMIDLDDPGPGVPEFVTDQGVPEKDPTHSVTGPNFADITIFSFPVKQYCTDLKATFTDMTLRGDFYNGTTNACPVGMVIPEGATAMEASHGDEKPMNSSCAPINMLLTLQKVDLTGRISATTVKHDAATITSDNRQALGMVQNTVSPVVNNGVIVSLDGESVWTVTGESHLSALTLAEGTVVRAPEGKKLTVTVDGTPTTLTAGSYTGAITLTVE